MEEAKTAASFGSHERSMTRTATNEVIPLNLRGRTQIEGDWQTRLSALLKGALTAGIIVRITAQKQTPAHCLIADGIHTRLY